MSGDRDITGMPGRGRHRRRRNDRETGDGRETGTDSDRARDAAWDEAAEVHDDPRPHDEGGPYDPTPMPGAEGPVRTAKVVYLLYLVGIFFNLLMVIGVIVAYVYRGGAPGWLRDHFTFQIRTFWIALIAAFVGGLTAAAGVGILLILAVIVWWIVRCIMGLRALVAGRGLEDPRTLWW